MLISLIWAQSQNGTIGRDNKLPWHLPNDLQYFKKVTMGKPIIMGRKTYESIGKPLPGRTNIVITRDENWQAEGVKTVHSLAAAYEQAEAHCEINGGDEAMVMGGADIYRQALADADQLYVTMVHAEVNGDAFAPDVAFDQWQEVSREDYVASGDNPFDYSFILYSK